MTDIVERLESLNEGNRWPMMSEAAAEIRQMRALLREALLYDSQIIHMESWWRKVRRALEPKP